tara:strand:+ start:159 stop:374 length:216 start_codon:yes stop_codon:yes gene_type:complete
MATIEQRKAVREALGPIEEPGDNLDNRLIQEPGYFVRGENHCIGSIYAGMPGPYRLKNMVSELYPAGKSRK